MYLHSIEYYLVIDSSLSLQHADVQQAGAFKDRLTIRAGGHDLDKWSLFVCLQKSWVNLPPTSNVPQCASS